MEEGRQKSKRLSYMAKFKREFVRYLTLYGRTSFEDKVDSDWVESTDNISVMSDDGESDE
jgi:hypothetical protein